MSRQPPVPKRQPEAREPGRAARRDPRRGAEARLRRGGLRAGQRWRPKRATSACSGWASSWTPAGRATWAGWASAPSSAPIRRPCGGTPRRSCRWPSTTRRRAIRWRSCEHGRARGDLGLRPGPRLSRGDEEQAEGAGPLHLGHLPARPESLRRHRAPDGKARGAAGRPRLAGQAHQPGVAPVRLVAVPGRDPAVGRTAGRPARDRPLRPMPRLPRHLPDQGLPRALSPRGAALHLLPHHRARGPDRPRAPARCSAIASMAATIAWRSARGTSSPRKRARRR